jgi:processive 1,2-diacylglycerol beta-glucosyltransferase
MSAGLHHLWWQSVPRMNSSRSSFSENRVQRKPKSCRRYVDLALLRTANHHPRMHILIATVTAGGGHLAAAAALDEAWRAARPRDVVERVDLVKFFSKLHKTIHRGGYDKLVEHAPELWGMLFKQTDSPARARKLARWRRLFTTPSRHRFVRFINRFKPNVVLCTHYLPFETLGRLREKKHGLRPFVASVVTDFEAHALWMDAVVDLYCVAAEETKARLVARGATEESIVVTGIPIAAKFSAKTDPKAVRKHYGLRDDQPVLLVLGGGFGMGPVAEVLIELDNVTRPFQTIVVAGRNEELRRTLAAQYRTHPTHILGFATNMHELMSVADLIITKPGGLTSSEALAMGRPLLILDPIPGQEAANSDFLLERGAAVKVNRVEDLPHRVEQLLASKKLGTLAKAAKSLGHPDAAKTICAEVVRRLAEQD